MSEGLKLERIVRLSPERCFALWSDPGKIREWWGPKDDAGALFRAEIVAWETEAGTSWEIRMTAPDGTAFRQGGEMLEVSPPHLLRFSFHWIEGGARGPATEICVRFEPEGGGTRVVFEQTGFADGAAREGQAEGWRQCLDRLAAAAGDVPREG